jgi:hypothetical protein
MSTAFIERNLSIGQLSDQTGKPVATIADWRKRGMIDGYGQPNPNGKGHWLYSVEDALKIHLAENFRNSGIKWKDALWMADIATTYLTGKNLYGEKKVGYTGRYLVFFGDSKENLVFRMSDDLNELFSEAFNWNSAPVSLVVDLVWTFINLPPKFLDGLRSLKSDT